MNVVYTRNELTGVIEGYKKAGSTVGFVPTMGALHEGHLSLVRAAGKACDISVVSIFVNPTQFNDPEDLRRYPRTPEEDLALLAETSCDVVFMPAAGEIYPEEDQRQFHFGYIESVMEGARRPGHFNGVAQVVSKLFDMVRPDKAFFGMKDFQQIAIIRKMTEQLNYGIEIVACPIVREESGLALSSRNKLLDEAHKKNAPHIYAVLKKAVTFAPETNAADLKRWIGEEIDGNPCLKTEYVEIVDVETLQPVGELRGGRRKIICVAVYAGKIRLIDNVMLKTYGHDVY